MTPQIIDLTADSPVEYRVRTRPASEVRAIVLHQTGFAWRPPPCQHAVRHTDPEFTEQGEIVIKKNEQPEQARE